MGQDKMKYLFLLMVLFIAGCGAEAVVQCESGSIPYGTACCADDNSNGICNEDEFVEITCSDTQIQFEKGCCNDINKDSICDSHTICPTGYFDTGTSCCVDADSNSTCDRDEVPEPVIEVIEEEEVPFDPSTYLDRIVTLKIKGAIAQYGSSGIVYKKEEWQGSGYFIDSIGTVVTNSHVIQNLISCHPSTTQNYCSITAVTQDGEEYEAEWLSFDLLWDVGLVKVKGITSRYFNHSSKARLGDQLYVLGAPYGLDFTVTKGIVSQLDENSYWFDKDHPDYEEYSKYLQTDAAVNPGNSGGPIINEDGEVIALATWGEVNADGLNYGLQSDTVEEVLENFFMNRSFVEEVTEYYFDSYIRSPNYNVKVSTAIPPRLEYDQDSAAESYVQMGLWTIDINNRLKEELQVCVNTKLANMAGIVLHKKSYKKTVKANTITPIKIETTPEIETIWWPFYYVEVRNCFTKELYAILAGPGIDPVP